jgi:MFS transporter, DHA1 family, multidrug resistance protein
MKLRTGSHPFILLLGAQSALPPLSIDSSLPALPAIAAALQATSAFVQWDAFSLLDRICCGSDRTGTDVRSAWAASRAPCGTALFVVAGVGCSLATSIDMVVAMRMLQGIGACAGAVVSRAIVIDLFSGRTAVSKQSVLASSSTVAMLCAPVLGGLVLTTFGWRINYAILPFSGIFLGLSTAAFLPETLKASEFPLQPTSGLFDSYARVLRDPDAIGFALLNAITFGGMFAYISGSSPVVIGAFGISPSMFGLLFAAAALALLAGSTLSVFVVKQVSPRLLRQTGLGILAVATSAADRSGGLLGPVESSGRPRLLHLCLRNHLAQCDRRGDGISTLNIRCGLRRGRRHAVHRRSNRRRYRRVLSPGNGRRGDLDNGGVCVRQPRLGYCPRSATACCDSVIRPAKI